MTENEIKESKEWLQDFTRMFGCNFDDLETRSFNKIVTYLEELQQYRAIGTVEELIKTQIREKVLNVELESYKEIGTIEEFKTLKEKSVAKKPIIKPWSDARCPSCGCSLSESLGDGYYRHFESMDRCYCGQKLDW